MSSTPQAIYPKDAWQNPQNARKLRAYMALRNQEIAERIIALRNGRHLSQKAVYEALGVSERGYQNWESGVTKPNYTSLQKLAEFYGVNESYILEGVDDRPIIEGVPEQLETIDGKFSELVQKIFDRDDEHRSNMYGLLEQVIHATEQLEAKIDRLMHLVDIALFTPPREEAGGKREHQPLREDQAPLVAALLEAFRDFRRGQEPPQTETG